MKKIWNVISKILFGMVFLIAVGIMLFTIFSANVLGNRDKTIFGYRALIAMSDSMKKTDFSAGDIVFIKETDPEELKEGDIIAYISRNPENYGETVTHKIRSFEAYENGDKAVVTYGTTTNTDDPMMVEFSDIIGKYEGHLPKLGAFFYFLKTIPGYLLCILLPYVLLIGFQFKNCVILYRQYKEEKAAEEAEELREADAQYETANAVYINDKGEGKL